MRRDLFLGFIKIHILPHAVHAPAIGLALISELAHHGYEVSPGAVCPSLHELQRGCYLACQDRVVHGKVRKCYRTTPRGQEAA